MKEIAFFSLGGAMPNSFKISPESSHCKKITDISRIIGEDLHDI